MQELAPDLFGPEAHKRWYETYSDLQKRRPVYQVPGLEMFVLTRYEDIATVIRDNETFSNEADKHGGEPLLMFEDARRIFVERGWSKAFPLAVDPPDHRKYRALVNRFFIGPAIERARPRVERHVHALIDRFAGAGEIEFVSAFADHLPALVITDMLGLPHEDIDQLKAWSFAWAAPFARGLSREQEIWVAEEGVAFQHYLKRHVDDRRASPRDDLISQLAHAELDDGRRLDDGEIVQILDHLYIGGNETTAYALTSGLWLMLREPDIYAQLKAEPGKIRTFVEESMRLESPTQGLYRTATRETVIRGVSIPKGATLHLRFAAANRDPAVFPEPEKIDLDRPNAMRHMAFSQAEHHCPGAGLSRMEQNVAFTALLERLPDLRLTPGRNTFDHMPGFVLRALKSLHVSFG